MIFKRVPTHQVDFINLVKQLDTTLAETDGDEHEFYHQFNGLDTLKHRLVGYHEEIPVAIGAIKELTPTCVEVKRMFTVPEYRGQGIGSRLLTELELWAKELDYEKSALETGKRQPDAIALYEKNGYARIQNYGQYKGQENSVCFEKLL
ncbi:GNAT family N-acetyltransferase [Rasiella rasia]|uniref:GNAT family N-acetyltransferase n=1 Tax=Rasiella rasia TaxID=2744027 RepID=A0A6G6GQH5_9FLAO|nr:GNAT family N-acetyltransferase [Rasiella rasia]